MVNLNKSWNIIPNYLAILLADDCITFANLVDYYLAILLADDCITFANLVDYCISLKYSFPQIDRKFCRNPKLIFTGIETLTRIKSLCQLSLGEI